MSDQPIWKYLANLGDATPLEYGGLFVYKDETGVYDPEMEALTPLTGEDGFTLNGLYETHRVCLERLKLVDGCLVPFSYNSSYPHPASRYQPWFNDSLDAVADCYDIDDLRTMLCSNDPLTLASAYRAIYDYHGWNEGDQYPRKYIKHTLLQRYTQGELA